MLLQKHFFRDFAIRRAEHLKSPRINNLESLTLPRGSVFHFLPESETERGIYPDHWVVSTSDRLVFSDHIEKYYLNAKAGKYRESTFIVDKEIRDYHRRYRKIKRVRDLSKNARDPRTPIVVNYSLVNEKYLYTPNVYENLYRDQNLLATLVGGLNDYSKRLEDRHHYFSFRLPDVIPKLSILNRAKESIGQALLEEFSTLDQLMVLELWKWLGPDRELSVFKDLDKEILDRINVIVQHDSKWILLNLGYLDKWRDGSEDEGDIDPDALKRRFLRLLIQLFQSATNFDDSNPEEVLKGTKNENDIEKDSPSDTAPEEPEVEKQKVKELLKEDSQDEEVEKELDELREVQVVIQEQDDEDPFDVIVPEPEDKILERANELSELGNISVGEANKVKVLIEKQSVIKSPYGSKESLTKFAKVDPESLVISKPETFPDADNVLDKSMLQTTVTDFEKRYIKEVMKKDIVGSVTALNNVGVVITDYNVESHEDVTGEYEIHTVRVNPLEGGPSTLRFKLPVVSEDGTFISNGIKYRMRKQRADVPIRKVKPERVALTSYYGKCFIDRSTKVVNNYSMWLMKTIMSKIADPEDKTFSKVKLGCVFNPNNTLPRVYSILASEISSFKFSGMDFWLDYDKRDTFFNKEEIKSYEKNGHVLVGRKGTQLITVDSTDTFYFNEGKVQEPLSNLESLLGLDMSKAPVDIAEVKIYSSSLPMGLVLGYYLGIEKLIKSLKVKIKIFSTTDQINLSDHEYKIVFKDKVLVVSKQDNVASMILGGFNSYKKSIVRYSLNEFNKRDVYFNLLDDNGMGNRHLKELRLMNDMFIDPITLELLKEMKEPTTWLGLLKRSVELLTTDYSPPETSIEFMRIRGYERMAGAVYNELVQSMRGFMAREGSQKNVLELNPFAVWSAVNSTGDSAITIVEESNPIRNITEKEDVTFMGTGGRSRDSMVDRTRLFYESEVGVISESTVDSGDVAINTKTVANPKFKNLRGMTERFDPKVDGASSVISTGALLSPAADRDDPKRVN